MQMEGFAAMGSTVASHIVTRSPGGAVGQAIETGTDRMWLETPFGARVEARLQELLAQVAELLERDRSLVLALTHALEFHRTVPGEDVIAIFEGAVGPTIDGRKYHDPVFQARLEEYHEAALAAHKASSRVAMELPDLDTAPLVTVGGNGDGVVVAVPYEAPDEPFELLRADLPSKGDGNGSPNGSVSGSNGAKPSDEAGA